MKKKTKTDEYLLYFTILNFEDFEESFGKLTKFYSEEIKNIIKKGLDIEVDVVAEDKKSLLINLGEEFEGVIKSSVKMKENLEYIVGLNRDSNFKIYPIFGIILSSEIRTNPFKKLTQGSIKDISNIEKGYFLVSEKVSLSKEGEYKFKDYNLPKLLLTDGVRVREYERLESLFIEKSEYEILDRFVNSERTNVFVLYGEIGTGKSCLINNYIEKTDNNYTNVKISASKNIESIFEPIIELTGSLLPEFDSIDRYSMDDIYEIPGIDEIDPFSRENLKDLIKTLYFGNESLTKNTDFNNLYLRISILFRDALEINYNYYKKPINLFIDDYDNLSQESLDIILSISENITKVPLKVIMSGHEDPEDNDFNCSYQKKEVENFNKDEFETYIKLVFNRKQMTKKFKNELHSITDANPYALKEYLTYLIYNKYVIPSGKYVKLDNYKLSIFSENLMDLFEEKFKQLDNNSENLLKLFSIFGSSVSKSDLDSLLHNLNYPYEFREGIEKLVELGLIRVGENRYYMNEPNIATTLYSSISDENRKRIHNLIGKIYENKNSLRFTFKTFYHYYKAENIEKIISILPNLLKQSYISLNYHSLKNIIRLTDKIFNSELEENSDEVVANWFRNKMYKVKISKEIDDGLTKEFDFVCKFLLSKERFEEFLKFSLELSYRYLDEKRIRKFNTIINRALEVASTHKHPRIEADLLVLQSKQHIMNEDVENYKIALTKSINIYRELGVNPYEIEQVLDTLSIFQFYTKDYTSCIETSNNLLSIYEENIDISRALPVLEMLALSYLIKKDYTNAEERYKTLYNHYSKLGEYELKKEIEIKLCEILSYNDKHYLAIEMLTNLIENNRVSPLLLMKYNELLGKIYMFMGDFDNSIESFIKSNQAAYEGGERSYLFKSYINLGLFYLELKDYGVAKDYFSKGKKLYKSGFNNHIARSFIMICDFGLNGKSDQIYLKLRETIAENSNIGNHVKFILSLALLNVLYDHNHYVKVREIITIVNGFIDSIYDFNLISKFKAFERDILRVKRSVKLLPTVKERVSNRVRRRLVKRRSSLR
ncbi:MAG: hypothetical protein CSA15_04165 [Candidatus Delongbacteria bacterium]|nr:MAG: hypothetical protein CSA15_04165 [Candidatus Delongbacteria bacterium]